MSNKTYRQKDTETLDYTVDWSTWLDGDTIASVVNTADSGITVSSESNTTTATTIWVSGGTVGTTYKVVQTITTSSSPARVKSINLYFKIVEENYL